MATRYGAQFESLMAEVCREFGAKLIKSWEADSGEPLDKAEVRDFVDEAVKNFFKTHISSSPEAEPEAEAEPVKKKAPAKKKGKAPAKKKDKGAVDYETDFED